MEEALPKCVFVGRLSFKVHPYRRPPLRCHRYGHIAMPCRGARRCGKCGGKHDISGCEEREVKCGVQQYRDANKGVSYAEALVVRQEK